MKTVIDSKGEKGYEWEIRDEATREQFEAILAKASDDAMRVAMDAFLSAAAKASAERATWWRAISKRVAEIDPEYVDGPLRYDHVAGRFYRMDDTKRP